MVCCVEVNPSDPVYIQTAWGIGSIIIFAMVCDGNILDGCHYVSDDKQNMLSVSC